MRVKLDQPVNTSDYGVTTCAALLDDHHAFVERVERFGKNEVTKYFVTLLTPDGALTNACFEIGKYAYESRAAQGQNVAPVTLPVTDSAPVLASFDGTTLSAPEYRFSAVPAWDELSQSFVFDLPAHALTSDLRACLLRSFAVCEIESAHYGETFVVSFFGTLGNSSSFETR